MVRLRKSRTVLQEHNMLGQGPEEIAKFLAKTTGLNKTMVGEYLGEREDMCLKVMHAYVDAMNFADMQFDEAIRWGPATFVWHQLDRPANKNSK